MYTGATVKMSHGDGIFSVDVLTAFFPWQLREEFTNLQLTLDDVEGGEATERRFLVPRLHIFSRFRASF